MLDLKIVGGDVLDGRGTPAVRADVGVTGDRIQAVGNLSQAEAAETIDASGCMVCPGFIDAHSHSDFCILTEPNAPSKITQGVTTEIGGNCGASVAPKLGENCLPTDWRAHGLPGYWSTVAEYRALFEHVKPALNLAMLVGHNTLRGGVMGYEGRPAAPEDIRNMVAQLEEALDDGACGLSTGLIYNPGLFATEEEIQALVAVAARKGKLYSSHMRSESAHLLESLDEVIGLARQTGVRAQVSHLKTSGRPNWPLLPAALERLRAARAEGLPVAADRYPYTASWTDLDTILPKWARQGGEAGILTRLRDSAQRERIREELTARWSEEDWHGVLIGGTQNPELKQYQGKRLDDVARRMGLSPVDAALHVLITDNVKTTATFFGMSEDNLWAILREPYVMVGSDSSLRSIEGAHSSDFPHPRAFGTFPRFLRAALDGRTVSVPEAVHKMTALTAEHFHVRDRGVIEPGRFADLVVVDPNTVRDTSTYEEPLRYAEGIQAVVVNGVTTWSGGALTGRRAGRFLD